MFDFLNSADPTISEPGKGYREPAVRVEFSRPVKLAPNSSAIGSRGWGSGNGRRKNTCFTENKTLLLNLYVLRQTVLCATQGKLQLWRPFVSKPSASCMLFQEIHHRDSHNPLSLLHRTVADDQGFSTCQRFCLTDVVVHLVLDYPL